MDIYNKKFHENKLQNRTLLESQNFRVIPSIGAIVEGWVLLIPKKHYVSFSEIDETLLFEAKNLGERTRALLHNTYQCEIVSFENGANSKNNLIGCGVDYAHIHFVPIKINLKKIIEKEFQIKIDWHNINSIVELKKYRKSSYFYIRTEFTEFATIAPQPKSQLIRKGIANAVGKPNEFDWKKYPFYSNVNKTINSLLSSKLTENESAIA